MAYPNPQPSPNGRYCVLISPIPMRMSHEVHSPSVHESADQKMIFCPGDLWDAGPVEWSEDSRYLSMGLRHYDNGSLQYALKLDLETQRGTLSYEGKIIVEDSFDARR